MRIEAPPSHVYSVQQARISATATESPSAVLVKIAIAKEEQGVKRADFTDMTRADMRTWINEQIRGGQMSLDESRPFMAMTMKMPVAGGTNGEVPVATDSERINFVERVRAGIDGAQSRGDVAAVTMLESALMVMSRAQGHAVGISTHA
jgi:hypothetical protein